MTEKFGGGYLNEGEDRFGYCVVGFFAARWWSSLALEIICKKTNWPPSNGVEPKFHFN
jgi:hypothetical protein